MAYIQDSTNGTIGMTVPFRILLLVPLVEPLCQWYQYCRPLAANSEDNLERVQNYQHRKMTSSKMVSKVERRGIKT